MEKKNNSGVLKLNQNRKTDTHPHFKGGATVDGIEYWVSAWKRTSKDGDLEFSLSFQAKQESGGSGNVPGFENVVDILNNL
jgi:hypothetical protein